MIAAALLTKPRLLLADEPATALDVVTQAEVMAILDDMRRRFGLAMLFITHDLDLAAAICDRTIVMYAGQIVEVRASALLHSDPLHPYTAALAAARPDITKTVHRLPAIPGRPLSAFEAPSAECAFAPRCTHARNVCRAAMPSLAELDGALSRCARAHELRGLLGRHPMPEASAPVLEAVRLRKQFGGLVAVDDVSFRLPPGRSLAMIGSQVPGRPRSRGCWSAWSRPQRTIAACGTTGPGRPAPPATGVARAARCRSSSRIRTPASTAAKRRVRR